MAIRALLTTKDNTYLYPTRTQFFINFRKLRISNDFI